MTALYGTGWDSPLVRSMMTTFLEPDLDQVAVRVWSGFLRVSGDGPAVAGFIESLRDIDATELARKIEIPTLVIHGQEDSVPLGLGRDLASVIPGARFEIIMGADHFEATGSSPKPKELVEEFLAPLSSK